MKEMLAVWTLETLQSNPRVFGGDDGNSSIMIKYLQETSTSDLITLITNETMSNAVSVSRLKNKILSQYPELDYRDKNKPKDKVYENPNQGTLFSIRDFIGESEKKILDYLDTDKERWNYPPSRIKKSIRGADISDIECVLKHKELYQKETLYSDYDGVSTDKRRQNPPNKVLAHAVGNKS